MAEGGSDDKKKKKKVMVAIDENDCSHYALEWTLDNLQEHVNSSSSTPLLIFNVQSISDYSYIHAAAHGSGFTVVGNNTAPELIKSIQEHQNKMSSALLEKAKSICANRGVMAETISEVGDPKEVICEAVVKFNVDLLVLGTHGKGALKRVFLGSVSNYCVQNAMCPVLVVKKPA